MWDLPRPGIERMSPALASRFFTTEPPAKPPTRLDVPNVQVCVIKQADSQPLSVTVLPPRVSSHVLGIF